MRTKFKGRLSLLFLALALMLAFPAVAIAADGINADADNLATGTANHSNSFSANQQAGTTKSYDFSAFIKNDGKESNNVFAATNDKVTTKNAFSGDWMANTGSTANLEFTAYDQNKVGQIAITVPCNAAADTSKSMTATLTASASNGKPLNPDSKTLTYTITATTPAASSCTESNTPPADDTTTTDITAPVIDYTLNPREADGSNGWYRGDVSLTWTVTENQSPKSLQTTGCVDQSITADQPETPYPCSATSTGGSTERSVTIKRDGTAPVVSLGGVSGTQGTNSWYTSAVTQTFDAIDATSGLVGPESFPQSSSGTAEGENVTIASGAVSDNAGNTNNGITAGPFKIDLGNPTNVRFVGGPAAEASYDFGDVPAAPTCTADDAVSGFASCAVAGHSTAVGTYTMTATATDNAGRTATATRTYTVKPWTLKGFYAPVDMGNSVINTAKNGSTVPLKFEVFKGTTELTDTAVVKTFTQKTDCVSGTTEDAIENYATGSTSLRYDATSGQFVFNWQTPKAPGACYKVTMTTQDGSQIAANFKLK